VVKRVRYYQAPRKARVNYRRGISTRTRQARTARIVAAAVAAAGAGAALGCIANEAGLLNKAPTQNTLGISATGLAGAALVVVGMFVRSEGLKLLFYGLGGGLLVEELTRQIDMRFYDFRVAFQGAPPLDYSQGISGAQVQLAQLTPTQEGFSAPSTPAQLPAPSPTASTPQAPASSSAPGTSIRPTLNASQKQALNSLTASEIGTDWAFWMGNLAETPDVTTQALRQVFVSKGMLRPDQGLPLEPQTLQLLNQISMHDLDRIQATVKAGATPVNAIEVVLRDKALIGPVESLGQLYSYFRQ
jgi:hypothetical protein